MADQRSCDIYIDCEADAVWATVADPQSIVAWMPGVSSCEVDGTTRRATLDGVGALTERFSVTPDDRMFEYSIIEAPFPLERHVGRVLVEGEGSGSCVTYECEVSPVILVDLFADSMQTALESLRSHMENEPGHDPAR